MLQHTRLMMLLQSAMILSSLKFMIQLIQQEYSSLPREEPLFSETISLCSVSSIHLLTLTDSSVLERERDLSGSKITLNTHSSATTRILMTSNKPMEKLFHSVKTDSSQSSTIKTKLIVMDLWLYG